MAFQSGAVANSMLVGQRDAGTLNDRELYTSVYVVSALSLFAHLPTFVVPIGVAFGWEATVALFAVRFLAIGLQIVLTLVISGTVLARFWQGSGTLSGVRVEAAMALPAPVHRRLLGDGLEPVAQDVATVIALPGADLRRHGAA